MALPSRSKNAREKVSSTGWGTIRRGWSGAYIVDFVSFAEKLIIELDGPQHLDPQAVEHDNLRDTWLTKRGFRIIRFRNQELDEDMRAVVDAIGRTIDELEGGAESPLPSPPRRGEGAEPS
jgi:very-short-patch-repair endonuclease